MAERRWKGGVAYYLVGSITGRPRRLEGMDSTGAPAGSPGAKDPVSGVVAEV